MIDYLALASFGLPMGFLNRIGFLLEIKEGSDARFGRSRVKMAVSSQADLARTSFRALRAQLPHFKHCIDVGCELERAMAIAPKNYNKSKVAGKQKATAIAIQEPGLVQYRCILEEIWTRPYGDASILCRLACGAGMFVPVIEKKGGGPMRESVKSLRVYFLLIGIIWLVGAPVALAVAFKTGGVRAWFLGLYNLGFALTYVYMGMRIRTLLADKPGFVKGVILTVIVIDVLSLFVHIEPGPMIQTRIFTGVTLLVNWYLYIQVSRLAAAYSRHLGAPTTL
ncbi:MAG: hypothetical protein ACYDEV_02155 [Acidiferrobacter sp.]